MRTRLFDEQIISTRGEAVDSDRAQPQGRRILCRPSSERNSLVRTKIPYVKRPVSLRKRTPDTRSSRRSLLDKEALQVHSGVVLSTVQN